MIELKAYKGDVYIPVYGSIADAEVYLKDKADEAIAELKDKCQMHDFFWEGCGFARRGFKNTIAVSEAFDRLEAENKQLKADVNNVLMQNQELCRALQAMYSVEEYMKLQNENAELKQKLHDAEMRADIAEAANTEYRIDLKNIKDNIAKHARDQYRKHNRQTLRALWLARALRAEAMKNYWYARSCHEGDERLWSIDGSAVKYIGCIKRTNYDWLLTWSEVECKCRAKAEEYR